ncbi:FAD-binding protein, partial [Mesorhizobium sp. M00.F.Ca.ET.149.01.1.1]
MKAAIHSFGNRLGRPFSPMIAASTFASTSTSPPRFSCCPMKMRAPEMSLVRVSCRVLGPDGQPVPGLYAVGEAAGFG